MGKVAKKLLDDVAKNLTGAGLEFFPQEPLDNDGVELQTQPTKLGNSILIKQKGESFSVSILGFPPMANGFLCHIDTFLRKEISKRFELSKFDLICVSQDIFDAKEIAAKISESFRCYEEAWNAIMSDYEIESLVNGVLNKCQ